MKQVERISADKILNSILEGNYRLLRYASSGLGGISHIVIDDNVLEIFTQPSGMHTSIESIDRQPLKPSVDLDRGLEIYYSLLGKYLQNPDPWVAHDMIFYKVTFI